MTGVCVVGVSGCDQTGASCRGASTGATGATAAIAGGLNEFQSGATSASVGRDQTEAACGAGAAGWAEDVVSVRAGWARRSSDDGCGVDIGLRAAIPREDAAVRVVMQGRHGTSVRV